MVYRPRHGGAPLLSAVRTFLSAKGGSIILFPGRPYYSSPEVIFALHALNLAPITVNMKTMYSNSASIGETLLAAIAAFIQTIMGYLPQIIVGLLILGFGLLLGKWCKSLVVGAVNSLNLDKFFASTSLSKFFANAQVDVKLGSILGEIGRWIVIYVFLISAVNFIGLTFISEFLTSILRFIPRVISAAFVLAVGIIAAGFIEQLIKSAIMPLDPSTARLAGKVSSYTVVIFALIIAVGELGIAQNFINILLIGFVSMISLTVGLSLGLGSKDLVAKILDGWYHGVNRGSNKPTASPKSSTK